MNIIRKIASATFAVGALVTGGLFAGHHISFERELAHVQAQAQARAAVHAEAIDKYGEQVEARALELVAAGEVTIEDIQDPHSVFAGVPSGARVFGSALRLVDQAAFEIGASDFPAHCSYGPIGLRPGPDACEITGRVADAILRDVTGTPPSDIS